MGRPLSTAIAFLLIFLSPMEGGGASSSPLPQTDQALRESVGARTLMQEPYQIHEVHCSRERSRAAWEIIEEYLTPFIEKEQYQISSKCRLHPDNDMFREQEQHKIHADVNHWKCGFCKKSFHAEKYLDQHFDNRHSNLLNDSHGRCLADLCGALHCDKIMPSKIPKTKCNPAAAAKNRHLCESLADNCFPINGGVSSSRLHDLFLHQFCDSHTCTGGRKPFSRGGRKKINVYYIAICILIVMFLPLFYLFVYLNQRQMKGIQDLKRISKTSHKKKPT
ncbi:hypothetical protein QJS10_CPA06g01326 [Acorus calamus]|uniref:C2H2-type domain-containing protein n=1 Tax=Acorus calamus TaxID=4465 RepID=A0AAV9ENX4_ACOCL|nr:hypothetical protein QJS10_CPA06g01326 [Acorus calamus]